MRARNLIVLPFFLLAASCFFPKEAENLSTDLPHVRLDVAFKELRFDRPVQLCHDGADAGFLYVAQQDGRIHRFENRENVSRSRVFLNLSGKVFSYEKEGGNNEEGLLGVAFHPRYAENGQFFVSYTAGNANERRTVLSRFNVSKEDPGRADPKSEVVLWDFIKPHGFHNGGCIAFGPDGFLYIAYGDGGPQKDPENHAQNLSLLAGKILRIDVDAEQAGNHYAIPRDNPFLGRASARPEIFAYGFRNPWRMSFDGENLWVGVVGQNDWEWVNLVIKGGNYGWSLFEGSHRFKEGSPATPVSVPIVEYSHDVGRCVIGGYVYRGERFPALRGIYIYADFTVGRVWGLKYSGGKVQQSGEIMRTTMPFTITSFGVDADNELYACGFDGRIYRVVEDLPSGSGVAGGR